MEPDLVPSSQDDAKDDEDEEQNEEDEAGGGGGGGKGRWSGVGSAMLGLGKKAAIAGAALTSAPVVVPPLFLFSALGLAFSVPFGIFFAGVACTDKLMQALLPPPSPRSQEQEEEEVDVLAEEREKKEVIEEEEKEVAGEKEVEEEEEEKEVEGEKEGTEVEEKEEVKEEQREVEEEKREEEGRRLTENEEENEAEKGEEVVMRWEGEGGRVIEREEQAMSARPFQAEIESSRLSSAYASAVEDQSAVETTDEAKSECSAEHGPEAKAGAAVERPSDDEGIYSEEKIWEQISALQTIVGYKSALRSSCVEELRALYLFTGVEPPASLKDPFDPLEVNDKLCFLKYLVGLE
ncbi:cilia- and flagella-associated protein 251-like [Phoenix dactylifera]|uniref:Cilia- and flagella-associated protein 251-like n=1 Tax=Phoenix dactylifera TaxID=42345 RepID=A0A8B7BY31_PHODC|nr:cilia- and flagella-associated protein 251-like [Phoenix dactylifera]